MSYENKITILYGSQTGTAQEFAERLWRKLKLFGFSGPVRPMDEYNIANLIKEDFALFVCSTTGVGEEPDNMKKFWKFLLRKNLPANSLERLKFAVLGLGDSSYIKFNYPAKKLHKRLLQLGANQIVDVGLCDYQHDLGHDSIAEPWLEKLWNNLKQYFPNVNFDSDNDFLDYFSRWKIETSEESCKNDKDIYYTDMQNNSDRVFLMKLKNNTKTTAENHFQDVRLLEFTPAEDSFDDYEPGDVLYLRPKNSKVKVDRFFKLFENHALKLDTSVKINVSTLYDDMPVPNVLSKTLSLYEIVEQYWDLSAIPKKYTFSVLGHVSEDKLEKSKCVEFCSAEGQEELYNYCNRPRRHILEVLEDFHNTTAKLTLESLFELFTCIKPRAFSIASSCKATKNKQIDLLVAVVKYYTKLKSERLGLCSNWLKNLNVGDSVYGWIKKGTFLFPNDETTPLIMIGPGTGLAPFRSHIMEKEFLDEATKDTHMLFFGCRNENGDFHCKDYFRRLQSNDKITLFCAFSRDQDDKIYVQHKIKDNSVLVWNWINLRKAMICVAGNSKDMPDGVKDSIIENVLCKEGRLTKSEAEQMLKEMEISGMLQLETW